MNIWMWKIVKVYVQIETSTRLWSSQVSLLAKLATCVFTLEMEMCLGFKAMWLQNGGMCCGGTVSWVTSKEAIWNIMKLLVEKEFGQFEECHSDIFNKGVPVEPILNHFAVSAWTEPRFQSFGSYTDHLTCSRRGLSKGTACSAAFRAAVLSRAGHAPVPLCNSQGHEDSWSALGDLGSALVTLGAEGSPQLRHSHQGNR